MKPSFLVTISAVVVGVGATASCTSSSSDRTMTHNPPMPTATENRNPPADPSAVAAEPTQVIHTNPPPPTTAMGGLPTWDDVPSGHPFGATNPPSPYLVVTPQGACYKTWEGGMMRGGPDRVMDCGNACPGTRIQCTDKAATLLAQAAASASASPHKYVNPPRPNTQPTAPPISANPPATRP